MSSLMDKYFNVRVKLRNDSHYNWENKAKDFIPLDGEMILYDIDDNHPYQLIKVGNGYTPVIELPFLNYIQTGKESGCISVNGNDIKVKNINTMAYEPIENYYTKTEVDEIRQWLINDLTLSTLYDKFSPEYIYTLIQGEKGDNPRQYDIPLPILEKTEIISNENNIYLSLYNKNATKESGLQEIQQDLTFLIEILVNNQDTEIQLETNKVYNQEEKTLKSEIKASIKKSSISLDKIDNNFANFIGYDENNKSIPEQINDSLIESKNYTNETIKNIIGSGGGSSGGKVYIESLEQLDNSYVIFSCTDCGEK